MQFLDLLHNLSVGDQRGLGGSTYDIPQQNGYYEVSDHQADAQLFIHNQQEGLRAARDNMGKAHSSR
jgi:hypothetical protein